MNKDKKEGAVYIMLEKKEKDSLDTEKLYNTKVGITSQDGYAGRKKRLSGIKVGNPREVTMEYYSVYFKHYKPFEKVIHEYLKNKKRYIRGEWFLLSGLEIMMFRFLKYGFVMFSITSLLLP